MSSNVKREFGDPTVELPDFAGQTALTVADRALIDLVDALRSGSIGDGDRLPPLPQVATALSVSPANARAAVTELESAGVVEVRQGRGGGIFVVNLPNVARAIARLYPPVPEIEVRMLFEAMNLTERGILLLATERCQPDHHGVLRGHADDVEAGRQSDMLDYSERTVRFLMAVASIANNTYLKSQLADLMNRVSFVSARRGYWNTITAAQLRRSKNQFREICEGVVAKDESRVTAAVEDRMALQLELRANK